MRMICNPPQFRTSHKWRLRLPAHRRMATQKHVSAATCFDLAHNEPEIVVLADRLLKTLPLSVLIAVKLVDRGVFHSCR